LTDSNDSTIIDIQDLCFSYGNPVNTLQEISLTIKKGEQIALVGHNGSGKSTLVKHLNGLLKPSSGSVLIKGLPTAKSRTARLAGIVALLFQNPDDQICKRTVSAEVAFGPLNLGYSTDKTKALVQKALSSFNLQKYENVNPHDLGYSQRKRLAIASIIAMDTPVIVLDEPTAGLDPQEIRMLESVLNGLKEEKKTVVIISHDMDFIAENTTRAICLSDGRKVFDGDILDFFPQQELLENCGLLCPQIVRLCEHFKLHPRKLTPENFISELTTI
jgi:energy-coupling factor transport system ATP-binding protein